MSTVRLSGVDLSGAAILAVFGLFSAASGGPGCTTMPHPVSANAGSPETDCASTLSSDPTAVYQACLRCGEIALAQQEPGEAESCLDRAIEHGHAQSTPGSAGKLEAYEARGDVRMGNGDAAGARLDYFRALSASRSRTQTGTPDYASLLEKAADASTALGLHGEAFAALDEAIKVVRTVAGANSHQAERLRQRLRDTAKHLQY